LITKRQVELNHHLQKKDTLKKAAEVNMAVDPNNKAISKETLDKVVAAAFKQQINVGTLENCPDKPLKRELGPTTREGRPSKPDSGSCRQISARMLDSCISLHIKVVTKTQYITHKMPKDCSFPTIYTSFKRKFNYVNRSCSLCKGYSPPFLPTLKPNTFTSLVTQEMCRIGGITMVYVMSQKKNSKGKGQHNLYRKDNPPSVHLSVLYQGVNFRLPNEFQSDSNVQKPP
jgi:hypothetical protein